MASVSALCASCQSSQDRLLNDNDGSQVQCTHFTTPTAGTIVKSSSEVAVEEEEDEILRNVSPSLLLGDSSIIETDENIAPLESSSPHREINTAEEGRLPLQPLRLFEDDDDFFDDDNNFTFESGVFTDSSPEDFTFDVEGMDNSVGPAQNPPQARPLQNDPRLQAVGAVEADAIRHRLLHMRFDGHHNNDSLSVSFDDTFSDVNDDHVERYNEGHLNLYNIHLTTNMTMTIQNMFNHHTTSYTGTMTHSYRTGRRTQRLHMEVVMPITFRPYLRRRPVSPPPPPPSPPPLQPLQPPQPKQ